jgi:hypothetical protein
MDFHSRAESLPLPEQLYLMLTDSETGVPPKPRRRRTQGVLAAGLVWELIERGALTVDLAGGEITRVSRQTLGTECLTRALTALGRERPPMPPRRAVQALAAHLPTLWCAIGESMLREGLVHAEVQTVLLLFHRRVLSQTDEAAREERTLEADLRAAVREIGAHGEAGIATQRRLVARLVLLDNFGLLRELVGGEVYDAAADRLTALKRGMRDASRLLRAGGTPLRDTDQDWPDIWYASAWFLDASGALDAPMACGDDCRAFGGDESGGDDACGDFSDAAAGGGCDAGGDSGGGDAGGGGGE